MPGPNRAHDGPWGPSPYFYLLTNIGCDILLTSTLVALNRTVSFVASSRDSLIRVPDRPLPHHHHPPVLCPTWCCLLEFGNRGVVRGCGWRSRRKKPAWHPHLLGNHHFKAGSAVGSYRTAGQVPLGNVKGKVTRQITIVVPFVPMMDTSGRSTHLIINPTIRASRSGALNECE